MIYCKNSGYTQPVNTGYSDGSGMITKKHLAFCERRAQYIGAITPEPFYLDKGLREIPTQMGLKQQKKYN